MKLREYQQKAADLAKKDLKEVTSTLLVMPTGTGKTRTFVHVGNEFAESGKRVVVLAHRAELVRQAADAFSEEMGEHPDIEMATEHADRPNLSGFKAKVICASVQSLVSGNAQRLRKLTPHEIGLLIIDEAHHAVSPSWRAIIKYLLQNPDLKILGTTATADRYDRTALGTVFERVSFQYEIQDAISDGYLVDILQRQVHVESLDLDRVHVVGGDLSPSELADEMEREANLHGIAHPTIELAAGRKTIVFAASVSHAELLANIFNRHRDGCAQCITGKTDEVTRRLTLKRFRDGGFQILVNVAVLTEGWDEPTVQVVVVARPTRSRAFYVQMIGRGTRPLPGIVDGPGTAEERRAAIRASGKPSVEIIDFCGSSTRHKLVCAADILGGRYQSEVVALAVKKVKAAGEAINVQQLLEHAKAKTEKRRREEEERRREAANRAKLIARPRYTIETNSPFDVLDVRPAREVGWETGAPASAKQIDFLRRAGIDNGSVLSKRHAGQLIGEIMRRRDSGVCSFGQAKWLKRNGYPTDLTKADASRVMNAWAANGWRRPSIDPLQQMEVVF